MRNTNAVNNKEFLELLVQNKGTWNKILTVLDDVQIDERTVDLPQLEQIHLSKVTFAGSLQIQGVKKTGRPFRIDDCVVNGSLLIEMCTGTHLCISATNVDSLQLWQSRFEVARLEGVNAKTHIDLSGLHLTKRLNFNHCTQQNINIIHSSSQEYIKILAGKAKADSIEEYIKIPAAVTDDLALAEQLRFMQIPVIVPYHMIRTRMQGLAEERELLASALPGYGEEEQEQEEELVTQ